MLGTYQEQYQMPLSESPVSPEQRQALPVTEILHEVSEASTLVLPVVKLRLGN